MCWKTASHIWIWVFFTFLHFVSAEQKNITAESGQNVTLTCRAPNNNNIIIEWSRADQESYVLLYFDGQFDPSLQHPSFKNRVDLQDRQMKDGDVSLILKDVTINDAGTYKCRVIQSGTHHLTLISTITLSVVAPPGPSGGSVGLIVGLSVPAVLLVAAVVGFLILRKRKQQNQGPYQLPTEVTFKNSEPS